MFGSSWCVWIPTGSPHMSNKEFIQCRHATVASSSPDFIRKIPTRMHRWCWHQHAICRGDFHQYRASKVASRDFKWNELAACTMHIAQLFLGAFYAARAKHGTSQQPLPDLPRMQCRKGLNPTNQLPIETKFSQDQPAKIDFLHCKALGQIHSPGSNLNLQTLAHSQFHSFYPELKTLRNPYHFSPFERHVQGPMTELSIAKASHRLQNVTCSPPPALLTLLLQYAHFTILCLYNIWNTYCIPIAERNFGNCWAIDQPRDCGHVAQLSAAH